MAKRKTTIGILREARRLVAQGWCQCTPVKSIDGQRFYCATGAIRSASSQDAIDSCRASKALRDVIRIDDGSPIFVWNDASGRTQKQVVAAFDRAIKRLEKSA